MGTMSEFPNEMETVVSAVLSGKVVGRRSGRPDCISGWNEIKP